jgi:hypothetical protein
MSCKHVWQWVKGTTDMKCMRCSKQVLQGEVFMNDDNDEDFFIDALKTFIVVGFLVLFVITAGAVIWEFVL